MDNLETIYDTDMELHNIASFMNACHCPEMLEDLRGIFPPAILNKAAKRLTPEKHQQIKQWAIELNKLSSEADTNSVQIQSSSPPHKPEFKTGDYIKFGNHFGYLRAKNPSCSG